ncbi:MAG TPA: hypothetical protein VGB53_04225 [Rubricoccaceae bacterium]|jgi:TPR repeat protein
MPFRLALILTVLLSGLTGGCQTSRLSPEAAARAAAEADDRGERREAAALYRQAARGGNLDAAMTLAREGTPRRTLGDWLFETRPTPAEAARWSRSAIRHATQLAKAGDPRGHLALASAAWLGPTFSSTEFWRSPEHLARARRHYDAAVALGSRNAIIGRAHFVWQTDGLLVAEPLIREGVQDGIPEMATLLSIVVYGRPARERGLDPRDAPGDLSLVDVVGSIRVLREAGFPETTAEANRQVAALRVQARAGNAEADSLLRALGV